MQKVDRKPEKPTPDTPNDKIIWLVPRPRPEQMPKDEDDSAEDNDYEDDPGPAAA